MKGSSRQAGYEEVEVSGIHARGRGLIVAGPW